MTDDHTICRRWLGLGQVRGRREDGRSLEGKNMEEGNLLVALLLLVKMDCNR